MDGTLHPKPMSMGMKLLPWSPMRCMTLSMTKAPLAMYPESSRTAMKAKRMKMWGKNTTTDPTPPMRPSWMKETIASESPAAARNPADRSPRDSKSPPKISTRGSPRA